MKANLILALAVAVILVASGTSHAAMVNSKHDLSAGSSGPSSSLVTTEVEVCVFCHAPHSPNPGGQPLWNHAAGATTSFTMYGTTIAGNSPDSATTPNAISLRCLSCHDGASAVDAYGGASGDTNKKLTGVNKKGPDLSTDHPISIATTDMGDTEANAEADGVKFYSGKVECPSCHDPHDTTNEPFLRASMTDSALCQACHNK